MSILNQHKKIFSLVQVELEKLGFTEFVYEPHFYSLDATKKFGDLTYNLTFQLLSKSISLGYVYGFILVNPVNKILKQFIPDLSDNNELITLKNHINGGKQEDFKKINEHLKTQKTGDYIIAIMDHIKKVDFPFFNKYPTMETINQEIINKVPEEDYFKWFPGASLNKIIIIMKLCNNPKYESYKSKNISIGLQFVKQNPQMWKTKYERYISLINFLDNGTYLKIIEKDSTD
ncbi:hypothetical protein [Cellulophaga baltica]|uniref:hypothetical protein n=1 Tax=Cellulophaga baltica TaxID=76594 RepID=UPI002493EC2C|nr:hypothetical protein [Cellulophaga baltica]